MKNDDLYKHDLIEHSKNPRNYGLLQHYDFLSDQYNPSCGDSVKLCGIIIEDKLTKVCFQGTGCVLSMAMASKLTDFAVGMHLDEVASFDEKTVEQLLGITLGLNRLQCGLLSIMALQKGIAAYKK
ncbi:MAG TPA: iron-sulfur cluster assembly scaffold protein [Candidatus Saccharimonadales bacterium]|nr:iron-sulfur cluster assembly scaffold protein [Candidatus Saccharimonadales bacterium]